MEFLKEILGEELFNQVAEKVNAHNGNEANRENQIKIGNLGKGDYVSTGKYNALQEAMKGKDVEITNANNLIAELKKASKGNEEMQQKFTEYEAENAKLQAELQETKMKAAIKVGLLAAHCKDVDYVTYKLMEGLKEKGEALELDENDNIKGWDARLSGLQTQLPTHFEGGGDAGKDGYTPVENKGLPRNYMDNNVITKEQFDKMGYNSRVEMKANNPELYAKLAN